jgi:hypothetical protein
MSQMWPSKVGEVKWRKRKTTAHFEDYCRTPKKVFENRSIAFRVRRWFVDRKVALLNHLNWTRNEKVMSIEKRRKTCFITWKSLFLFFLFCNYSFASAVQRGIEKLKLALPWYFKTLKMEKNWEGSAKVFVDGLFYPTGRSYRSGLYIEQWMCTAQVLPLKLTFFLTYSTEKLSQPCWIMHTLNHCFNCLSEITELFATLLRQSSLLTWSKSQIVNQLSICLQSNSYLLGRSGWWNAVIMGR